MSTDFKMPECSGFLHQSHLEQLAQPAHEALLELIRSCSDPHVRTTVVTALVMSVWQYANKDNSPIKPSLVLVNTTGKAFDPLMAAMDSLLGRKDKLDKSPHKADGYVGTPDKARQSMHNIVGLLHSKDGQYVDRKAYEDMYHKARRTAYGPGSIHNYSQAWHPKLGLVTGRSNTTALLIEANKDKTLFREHLLNDPGKLSSPSGIGNGLKKVCKSMQVSASLSPSECDNTMVDAIMQLGRPYIILPHLVHDFINIPNVHAVSHCFNMVRPDWSFEVTALPCLPDNNWCGAYQKHLWARLGRLPLSYRYPIIELVHRLENTCDLIAEYAGVMAGGIPADKLTPLKLELYTHSLRGIVLSITGLAWHGLGLDPAYPLTTTRKLLQQLREEGSMSLRDIQRSIGYKTASERDSVIECLSREGLLQAEGKMVTGFTYPDYIRGLGTRHGLPDVPEAFRERDCHHQKTPSNLLH